MAEPIKNNLIPEVTVYSKRDYSKLIEENKLKKAKYLSDMDKYKKDSTEWVTASKAYQDSLKLYKELDEAIYKFPQKFEGHTFISIEDINKEISKGKVVNNINPNANYRYEGDSGKNRELSRRVKPIGYLGVDERDRSDLYSKHRELYPSIPVYKKPTHIPTQPTKPTSTEVQPKYDSTYESLRMRPLWPIHAKQDTTAKIGTLKGHDPLYENGFTIQQARKFPKEVIDYTPGLSYINSMKKEGGKINWLEYAKMNRRIQE